MRGSFIARQQWVNCQGHLVSVNLSALYTAITVVVHLIINLLYCYYSDTGLSRCSFCEDGHYIDVPRATECLTCENGKTEEIMVLYKSDSMQFHMRMSF